MHFLFLVVEFKESWNILSSLQKKLKEGFIDITFGFMNMQFPMMNY